METLKRVMQIVHKILIFINEVDNTRVTFSQNICTRKSEFLFIYENKFTTHQKLGGHLLFRVNLLQERHLNSCELFYPISEALSLKVRLHQGEEARQPCQPRTCQEDLQTPRNCIQGYY